MREVCRDQNYRKGFTLLWIGNGIEWDADKEMKKICCTINSPLFQRNVQKIDFFCRKKLNMTPQKWTFLSIYNTLFLLLTFFVHTFELSKNEFPQKKKRKKKKRIAYCLRSINFSVHAKIFAQREQTSKLYLYHWIQRQVM